MEEHNEKPDIKIKKSKKINRLKIINDNHNENIDELSNMFKVVSLEENIKTIIESDDNHEVKSIHDVCNIELLNMIFNKCVK